MGVGCSEVNVFHLCIAVSPQWDAMKLSLMIEEANKISAKLKKNTFFSRFERTYISLDLWKYFNCFIVRLSFRDNFIFKLDSINQIVASSLDSLLL